MKRRLAHPRAVVLLTAGLTLVAGALLVVACDVQRPADTKPAVAESPGPPDSEPAAAPAAGSTDQTEKPTVLMTFEEANGFEIYQRYCLVCHGTGGAGDGFNAFNLDPRPRSLVDKFMRTRFTDEAMAKAIRQGGRDRTKSLLMPPWVHTLSHRQIRYVISYVRLLQRQAQATEESSTGGSSQ